MYEVVMDNALSSGSGMWSLVKQAVVVCFRGWFVSSPKIADPDYGQSFGSPLFI